MKKKLFKGVVLAAGLLVSGLQANVSSGEGINEIYRKCSGNKIKTNNDNIIDMLNFEQNELSKCVKAFIEDSKIVCEGLKKAMKTKETTDDSSALKTVKQNESIIDSHHKKIKNRLLLCLKNIHEQSKKIILESAQATKNAVEDLEKKLGKGHKKIARKQVAKKKLNKKA